MIRCPYCGKSHYTENYHTSTCIGWTPVVIDGVRYEEDPNTHTTHCTCCECGGEFAFDNKGAIIKKMSPEEIESIKLDKAREIKEMLEKDIKSAKEIDYSKYYFNIEPFWNESEWNKVNKNSLIISCETIKLVSDTIDITLKNDFFKLFNRIVINGHTYVLKEDEKVIKEVLL